MKKSLSLLVILFVSFNVYSDQMLAMQSGCMGCHRVDVKLIGPAFKDIAAKYKGQEGIEKHLTQQVKMGSPGGVWGSTPMIASHAPEKKIEQVIRWILTQ